MEGSYLVEFRKGEDTFKEVVFMDKDTAKHLVTFLRKNVSKFKVALIRAGRIWSVSDLEGVLRDFGMQD